MIVAAMATMPDREPYLEGVVAMLRPQVDALRVYLNNFVERPPFLSDEEGILSGDAEGDLGDSGKFYWFDKKGGLEHTHYLTVDDDLGYPANYVATLQEEFDARDGKAVVGVHGSIFSQPIESFVTSRYERFRFYESLDRPLAVHLLGTATVMLSQKTLDLSMDNFKLRNAADLQLAIAAQKQKVPMVALARPEHWVTEKRPWTDEGFSIWKAVKTQGKSLPQTQLAKSAIHSWELFKDPLVDKTLRIARHNEQTSILHENPGPFSSFDECVEALNEKKAGNLFLLLLAPWMA